MAREVFIIFKQIAEIKPQLEKQELVHNTNRQLEVKLCRLKTGFAYKKWLSDYKCKNFPL